MYYRIPGRPSGGRVFGMIALTETMVVIGTLARGRANPLLVVGTVFVVVLILLVIGVATWFVVSTICDKRNEEQLYQRQQAGLCGTCAYDLRKHAADQCPECGMPVFRKWVTPPVAQETTLRTSPADRC